MHDNDLGKPIKNDEFWQHIVLSQANEGWHPSVRYDIGIPTVRNLQILSKAIEFAPLTNESANWIFCHSMCKQYTRTNVFSFFIQREEIRNILNNDGKAGQALKILVKAESPDHIKALFSTAELFKLNWNYHYLNNGETSNPLCYALLIRSRWTEIFSVLIKTGQFDANLVGSTQKRQPILECANTSMNFDFDRTREDMSECNNFKYFKFGLCNYT